MKIKTELTLIILLVFGFVVLTVGLEINAVKKSRLDEVRDVSILRLQKNLSLLLNVSRGYQKTPGQRVRQQWYTLADSLSREIASFEVLGTDDKLALQRTLSAIALAKNAFNLIADNYEQAFFGKGMRRVLPQAAEDRMEFELDIHLSEVENSVNTLLQMSVERRTQDRTAHSWQRASLLFFLGFSTLVLVQILRKSVFLSITNFSDGIRTIRSGRLGHQIPIPHSNEIGEIISEFNLLTSELVTAREQMHAAKEDAERANAAKSEFLANMSHEIRTPLNGIIGISDILASEELDEKRKSMLAIVTLCSNNLLQIVNDILDLSKIEAAKVELVHREFLLHDLMRNLKSTFAIMAYQKGLEVIFSLDSQVPEGLVGDHDRLVQILGNLVGNAIKFTPRGHVLLKVEVQSMDAKTAELLFSIEDTGVGIPDDRKNDLFQPFVQADSSLRKRFQGTGLGLVIAKKLAQLMAGDVWFRSELGHGTTFFARVILGRSNFVQPIANLNSVFGSAGEISAAGGCDVLHVERNPLIRNGVAKMLAELNITLTVAEDGPAALSLVAETRHFDFVLINLDMAELKASGLLEKLNSLGVSRPHSILILSPLDAVIEGFVENIAHFGCYLTKPILKPDLLAAMSKVATESGDSEANLTTCRTADLGASSLLQQSRVLIVDDNYDNLMYAVLVLDRLKIPYDTATSGAQALEMCEAREYSLILMDIQMPGMSGVEAMKKIRTDLLSPNCNTPFVAVTAYATRDKLGDFLKEGFSECLVKPFLSSQLETVVSSYVSESREKKRLSTLASG